ncbi:hypothetical protein AB7145_18010, partial [Escherichia coli]
VCVVGKIRDLILQLSKSSIYSTKPFYILVNNQMKKKPLNMHTSQHNVQRHPLVAVLWPKTILL